MADQGGARTSMDLGFSCSSAGSNVACEPEMSGRTGGTGKLYCGFYSFLNIEGECGCCD